MKDYVIGVDIGTGSTKAVAVDISGKAISIEQLYYSTSRPQTGYAEQNPEIIWNAFVKCIRKTINKNKRLPVCVSISSAMHSLLVVDNANKAITPLITWEDTRSEKIAEAIKNSPEAEKIYSITGTPIHAMSPLCKIKWFKENETNVFKKASKFISIKEFIWFRLFNAYEIDHSIASATGLFNIKTFDWNKASLELCGITSAHLSTLVATDFIRKNVDAKMAKTLHVDTYTKFCIGASDGCLANVGSNVIKPGIAALTIGTSGAVRITSNMPVVNYEAMIFNYILDKKTFISGGPVNNGGNVMKWLFKAFLKIDKASDNDYKELFKSVENIKAGSEGLLFLPYIYGERAPVWDGEASGAFFGIKSFHTNAHFLRATLEGICFALNNILEIIEASTTPIKQLNVSGGFVHSKTWMHILGDISGKKICLAQSEDASSVGAALLGMKAIGIIDDYSLLHKNKNMVMMPNKKNHQVYEKYYNVFKNLYQPLKDSMHQLQHI